MFGAKVTLLHGRLARDSRGSMAVEFALLVPVLAALMFGMTEFGVAMYTKIEMTDAARSAARTLSIGRASTTVFNDTKNQFFASAPGIPNDGSVTLVMTVNGVACTSNSDCQTKLNSAVGSPATVTASRACRLVVFSGINLVNYMPGCTLRSSTTTRIE
jgi:Flp pilus assembly protein TadG